MVKLLYLLTGVLLKQTIDELKALSQESVRQLERQLEATAYRPVPAVVVGSSEAASAVARHSFEQTVQPERVRLAKAIKWRRRIPLLAYGLLTISAVVAIIILERVGYHE